MLTPKPRTPTGLKMPQRLPKYRNGARALAIGGEAPQKPGAQRVVVIAIPPTRFAARWAVRSSSEERLIGAGATTTENALRGRRNPDVGRRVRIRAGENTLREEIKHWLLAIAPFVGINGCEPKPDAESDEILALAMASDRNSWRWIRAHSTKRKDS